MRTLVSSHWRRLGALAVGVASLVSYLPARPVAADPVAEKRAEAARLARQIDSLGERVSVLDEQYNEARLGLAKAQEALTKAAADRNATSERFGVVRTQLQARAVEAYTQGGDMNRVAPLVAGDGENLVLRREYLASVAGDERRTLDALRAAREDLEAQQARLEKVTAQAKAAQQSLERTRRQTAAAVQAQEAALGRVQGELSDLVAEAQARAAAAAEARARAALADRQAAERARAEQAAAGAGRATRDRDDTPARPAAPSVRTPAPAPDDGPDPDEARGAVEKAPAPAPPEPADSPAPSSGAAAAVAEAKRQVGKPYRYGGSGPDSFDCSGLTAWAWRAGGVSLPHSSRAQYSALTHVPFSDVQPGDLLFYGSPIHHVGIAIGGGQMVEASQTGRPVRYASIYRRDLAGVGRPR